MNGDLLATASELAVAAGRAALAHYAGTIEAERKADGSPVTLADRAAHATIAQGLAPLGIPLVSEESPPEEVAARRSWTRFWLVDPLDGTKEFLKKSGEFTVNIALIEENVPVLGVVHIPVTGVTYVGSARGAFVRDASGERSIRTRSLPAEVVVLASRDHAGPDLDAILSRLPRFTRGTAGSAIKFGLVAEGRADLYLRTSPTMEWDTAAGQCVVEAAGGRLTDFTGKRLTYNRESQVNPGFVAWGDASVDWPRRLGLR